MFLAWTTSYLERFNSRTSVVYVYHQASKVRNATGKGAYAMVLTAFTPSSLNAIRLGDEDNHELPSKLQIKILIDKR